MNKISYEHALCLLEHRESHLRWLENMQVQGDLALVSGDFAAYARNTRRMLAVPVSTSPDIQPQDRLDIDARSIPLPPFTTSFPDPLFSRSAIILVEAAYGRGCARALPLVLLHGRAGRLPYRNAVSCPVGRNGMTDIDRLLETGGEECWEEANKKVADPDYKALLGICHMWGIGTAEDAEKALACFLDAADRSALAQFCIGICYEKGLECPVDMEQAGKWYRLAARNGCWQAAEVLFWDSRFNKEKYKAEKAYIEDQYLPLSRQFAEQGDAAAQYNLGWMCDDLFGVAWNPAEAVKWYRKSAEQGYARAQCNLGWMYEKGRGVATDNAEAVKWYRKSAVQGNARAQGNLGWMYENGRGVAKDDAEAVKWYRKSAEQGCAAAQCNLGDMYENGRGVAKDEAEAVKWYRKAAAQGYEGAKNELERLGK